MKGHNMKIAPIPANEAERLAVLKKYEILDTEAEKQFDDLTQLASFICGTPISLVSLIDADRQWFKAKKGIDSNESPRDISFCAHVILDDELMIVNDATKDERFFDNPVVTGPFNLRFYAGAPLIDKSGHRLGSLCVVDHKPRELSSEQKDALKKLSAIAVAQMELRLEIKKQIEREEMIKKTSLQMVHSAKMSTLGEMAGGVAHEINNPLAIIQGKVFLLKKMLEGSEINKEKMWESLSRIEFTTQRIAKIVNGLLNFSRDTSGLHFESMNLQKVLSEALVLCEERFKLNDVELRFKQAPDVELDCRPLQLSQAFLNLLLNSYDAVYGTPNAWIEIETKLAGDTIEISVTDSGHGIEKNVVDKMLNPFFTTKELGKGTGLGLPISKGIVEAHNGELFYDESSANTRFVIKIPKLNSQKLKSA